MSIRHRMFFGVQEAEPGQAVLSGSWVVPAGVFSIHAVSVGGGISRGSTTLLGISVNDGGGSGGAAPGDHSLYGGGGDGGYLGSGGAGGALYDLGSGWADGLSGSPGSGGGGGGGGGGAVYGNFYPSDPVYFGGGRGGGVGLKGVGDNGAAGYGGSANGYSGGTDGGPGSAPDATGGSAAGTHGRYLAWRNNIPVTPGETLTVTGYTRAIWGGGRSYPYNAGDV